MNDNFTAIRHELGTYTVELLHPRGFWRVRKSDATEHLSEHNTAREARHAVIRYQRADDRRARKC